MLGKRMTKKVRKNGTNFGRLDEASRLTACKASGVIQEDMDTDGIVQLAEQVMRVTGTRTKTEAVRQALQAALKAAQRKTTLEDKIRPLQARVAQLGPVDPDFDIKNFTDEIWENTTEK